MGRLTEPFDSVQNLQGKDICDLALTHGMRISVQNMGNGVLRGCAPSVLPLEEAMRESEREGWEPFQPEDPFIVRGLTLPLLSSLGVVGVEKMRSATSAIFAHAVNDTTLDLLGWFTCLGGC